MLILRAPSIEDLRSRACSIEVMDDVKYLRFTLDVPDNILIKEIKAVLQERDNEVVFMKGWGGVGYCVIIRSLQN